MVHSCEMLVRGSSHEALVEVENSKEIELSFALDKFKFRELVRLIRKTESVGGPV